MGAADTLIAAVILAGAGYLLYRSLWKKRGHCAGCAGGGCGARDAPVVLRPPSARRRDADPP
jgi:hypothetical protein